MLTAIPKTPPEDLPMALHLFYCLTFLHVLLLFRLQAVILGSLGIKMGHSFVVNWAVSEESQRFDCLPQLSGNETTCLARGCIWKVRRPLETSCFFAERNNLTLKFSSCLILSSFFLPISRPPSKRSPGASTPKTMATTSSPPTLWRRTPVSPLTSSATPRTTRAARRSARPTSTPSASRCFTAAPPCCASRWVRLFWFFVSHLKLIKKKKKKKSE